MYNPKSIPDIFKSIVANVSTAVGYTVHFKFGTRKVINDELKNTPNNKFPLIALVDGWQETPEDSTIMALDGLTLIIAVRSEPTTRAQDRNDNNYVPFIFPIYKALCDVIGDSFFFTGYNTDFKHKVRDWPNMGLDDGTRLFEDCLDGRVLEDISLRLNLNFECSPNPYTPEGPIILPPATGWSMWGNISGVITDQTDLIAYIASAKAAWGGIQGTITDQTDLIDYLNSLETVWGTLTGDIKDQQDLVDYVADSLVNALSLYATESYVNSQGFITSAALSGYATTSYVNSQGFITSAALSGLVPYTGANANVDLGAFTITTPCVIGGSAVGSNIIYKSTSGAGATSGIAHQFTGGNNGATIAMTILNSGLVGIGMIAPAASLVVRGASASTGNALVIQNATPTDWFWVANNGITYMKGASNGGGGAGTVLDILQIQRASGSPVFSVNTFGGVVAGNTQMSPTSGAFNHYDSGIYFAPTSGTATFIGLNIRHTINQTGGASGNTVSILINPTLTAAASHRGLEISAMPNQIRLNSGVTNPSLDGAITYLTTNQRLVLNQNTTVREFVTSDATTGAAAAATGSIRVRINGTNYDLLFK